MAHFAKLNENNIVIDIVVVNNNVLDPKNEEKSGINFLNTLFNSEQKWVQTSYNNKFRKQYATIGSRYDENSDIFILPQPFNSWTLDHNYDWQPPIPRPEGAYWYWDEDSGQWNNG